MMDWQSVKTQSASDDINKFVQIHGKSENKTKKLLVDAYLNVSKQFPMVRFYEFRKQVEKVIKCDIDWGQFGFKPDGYYLGNDNGYYDIFLIEIENTSRLTKKKIKIISLFSFDIDCVADTRVHIIEFNRFGDYQRCVPLCPYGDGEYFCEPSLDGVVYKDGFELLKKYHHE